MRITNSAERYMVGDQLVYTGRIGPMPAEFRGYHFHPETGERVGRVIVRPEDGPPFETSVYLHELTKAPDRDGNRKVDGPAWVLVTRGSRMYAVPEEPTSEGHAYHLAVALRRQGCDV